jgi:hypothetical protein
MHVFWPILVQSIGGRFASGMMQPAASSTPVAPAPTMGHVVINSVVAWLAGACNG